MLSSFFPILNVRSRGNRRNTPAAACWSENEFYAWNGILRFPPAIGRRPLCVAWHDLIDKADAFRPKHACSKSIDGIAGAFAAVAGCESAWTERLLFPGQDYESVTGLEPALASCGRSKAKGILGQWDLEG